MLLGLDPAIAPRTGKPSPITVKLDSVVLLGFASAITLAHPVPRQDLVFAVLFPAYLAVMNQWRFGGNAVGVDREFVPLLRQGGGAWFKRYVLSFALFGLLLPLLIVFGGCVGVPTAVSSAAAPHLLLTLVQCACEGLTRSPSVAALVRLLIPIGFNAYRMGALATWTRSAGAALGSLSSFPRNVWPLIGLALALANLLMWTYNLFVFLLWRTVPQYMDPVEFPTPTTKWRGALLPQVTSTP